MYVRCADHEWTGRTNMRSMNVCMYAWMRQIRRTNTCKHTHSHTHTHKLTQTHTHTHTHTHTERIGHASICMTEVHKVRLEEYTHTMDQRCIYGSEARPEWVHTLLLIHCTKVFIFHTCTHTHTQYTHKHSHTVTHTHTHTLSLTQCIKSIFIA